MEAFFAKATGPDLARRFARRGRDAILWSLLPPLGALSVVLICSTGPFLLPYGTSAIHRGPYVGSPAI